ncbi:MAG: Fur family transcriptional regulator [Pikeienuella sp.]
MNDANHNPAAMAAHDHAACIRHVLGEAEAAGINFTPVRLRALEILLESHAALGAYELLKRLEAEGFGGQPPVAYRALDFLVAHGFAHRIERLNAFVACMRPGEGHDPAFMICRRCRAVAETEADPARDALGRDARAAGFEIERTMVEIEGLCPKCRAGAPS